VCSECGYRAMSEIIIERESRKRTGNIYNIIHIIWDTVLELYNEIKII
jgi:hypothetical protein